MCLSHFSSAERKELSTVNSVSGETILQERRGNQEIFGKRKIEKVVIGRYKPEDWLKEALQTAMK